jgi:hypothetical protein
MDNYFWLVVLPNLDCFFVLLGVIGIFACAVGCFMYADKKMDAYTPECHAKASKFGKCVFKGLSLSLLLLFISCFIPTKKDIMQLKVLSLVSEIKGIDQIPQKIIDRLNEVLEAENKE